ncbi:hypothetical protein ZWY2020_048081 [Hordeum vulgare]|nr:hypothetical protein ZWY2020_048081 [Hordeum vulgare]
MLRLRSSILAHLLSSSPAASPASPLHRLISAAVPAIPPNPSGFAVEEYLVSTCGLTQVHAVKASTKLSHLKSPAKPDAVLAFLAGLGLSGADVAALVAKDPRFLCANVERVLAPNVAKATAGVIVIRDRCPLARPPQFCHRAMASYHIYAAL